MAARRRRTRCGLDHSAGAKPLPLISLLREGSLPDGRDGPARCPSGHRAVAEKVATLDKSAFFAERRTRADFEAFDQLMSRLGSRPLPFGDEAP